MAKHKKKKKRSKASGGHRRGPTQKAKQAYYRNVRKAYSRLKKVAETHGFA